MTIEIDFTTNLRRDDDLEVFVVARGEIEPADRSVGIMHEGIAYVDIISATDANGAAVTLSGSERDELEKDATPKLEQKLCDAVNSQALSGRL